MEIEVKALRGFTEYVDGMRVFNTGDKGDLPRTLAAERVAAGDAEYTPSAKKLLKKEQAEAEALADSLLAEAKAEAERLNAETNSAIAGAEKRATEAEALAEELLEKVAQLEKDNAELAKATGTDKSGGAAEEKSAADEAAPAA